MDSRGNRLFGGDVVIEIRAKGKLRRFKNSLDAEQHIFALQQMGYTPEVIRKVWR